MTPAELERELRDLGAHLAYPPTPPLGATVRARLREVADAGVPPPAPPAWALARPPWWLRRPVAVAAAILLVLALLLGTVPNVRDTVAHWLGITGVTIERVPASPSPTATSRPQPSGSATPSLGESLRLGTPSSLADAAGRIGFAPRIPALLGDPDQVYLRPFGAVDVVSLVYLPRSQLPDAHSTGVGLLVTEFRGAAAPELFSKLVGPGTTVEPVVVAGASGYWIAGAPHVLGYRGPNGQILSDETRLADNTLLWDRDGVTYRLESALSRDQALAIAASMR